MSAPGSVTQIANLINDGCAVCMAELVDMTAWASRCDELRVGQYVAFIRDEDAYNITGFSGVALAPRTIIRLHQSDSFMHHACATVMAFAQHMKAQLGIDLVDLQMTSGRGSTAPSWHEDGNKADLRTAVVLISPSEHTQFMDKAGQAVSCVNTSMGSAMYFTGTATHRSPYLAYPQTRSCIMLRFGWADSVAWEKEVAALREWSAPSMDETSRVQLVWDNDAGI